MKNTTFRFLSWNQVTVFSSSFSLISVAGCVFASTRVISLGQVSVCLPVSLYEVSVCSRNAPCPICHWILLLSPSSWCLEVELRCAPASEKYVLFFFVSLFCSVYLHMFLDENVTWWKSIRDSNCIQNENAESKPASGKSGKLIIKHHSWSS